MRPILRRKFIPFFLLSGFVGAIHIDAATIAVGTADQKISGVGPCSLQEAIYASTLRASLTVVQTDPDVFAASNCTAGTGDDTIVLPGGALFPMTAFLDGDAYNPYGPTATPIVFSTITIEGFGATLEWAGSGNVRLFAVGSASIKTPGGTVSGTGSLTLRNLYIKGFHVKGGDGADGGGGGLGAGGAVYLQDGTLTIENCTFDGNGAQGGSAIGVVNSGNPGGGGGGLGGNGGGHRYGGGSGGGGARGDGGVSDSGSGTDAGGGGGGGTVFTGGNNNGNVGGASGYLCGGNGGDNGNHGHDGKCPGGGGGGGGAGNDGGNGAYGGGGGGACDETSSRVSGGDGGFGGGGGGTCNGGNGGSGGNGGFGGGGGIGDSFAGIGGPGSAGYAGGAGSADGGGGGGALGGAIFNDSGTVTIHNSTFTNNYASRGTGVHNGGDAGAAIFSHNGSLTVVNATVSGNQGTGTGAGIAVLGDDIFNPAGLTLDDTLVANNGADECITQGNVSKTGVGNLVMSNGSGAFDPCPGVVVTDDPHLGLLHMNGGKTPTMALFLGSSALGHADSATSLGTDQRGAKRPQNAAFDIGAYELCRGRFGLVSCNLTFLIPSIAPAGIAVDDGGSATSDNNGVLEPGETVPVKPSWRNLEAGDVDLTATASGLTGPLGPTYTVADGTGDYGAITPDTVGECVDCYVMSASKPASRPATHWDLFFTEITNQGQTAKVWTLHVGESFTDVPKSQPFYKKIETLLHVGITAGCTPTAYCPGDDVSRSQMAIFLARAIAGIGATLPVSGNVNGSPYDCESGGTSLFTDVAPTDPECKAVHYIAAKNVTTGCAPNLFCPTLDVMRSDMAIFVARAIVAPGGGAAVPLTYTDSGTGLSYSCNTASPNLHFSDIHVTDPFCKHVHYLWARGMVSGCTATTFCPTPDVTRDVMAKFLVNAFSLQLYAP
jgi:hypothetical protein